MKLATPTVSLSKVVESSRSIEKFDSFWLEGVLQALCEQWALLLSWLPSKSLRKELSHRQSKRLISA